RRSANRIGKFIPAVRLGNRERRPLVAVSQICAVDLATQRSHAIVIARVEDPYAPRGVPNSPETTGFRREMRVIRTADCNAAVSLFNDRKRHATTRSSTPNSAKARIRMVKIS